MPQSDLNRFYEGLMTDIDNYMMSKNKMKKCENLQSKEPGSESALTNIKGHLKRNDLNDIYNVMGTESISLDYVLDYGIFDNEVVLIAGETVGYDAAVISFMVDDDDNVLQRLLWRGNLNWTSKTKLTVVTNWENENIKRVYINDSVNGILSLNIARENLTRLFSMSVSELKLDSEYNVPTIRTEVINGGGLNSMKVQYTGRYVARNGSLSEFFPLSDLKAIYIDRGNFAMIEGGLAKEDTGKAVKLYIEGIDDRFDQLEIYALQYESKDTVTAIKTLAKIDINGANEELFHKGDETPSSVSIDEILIKRNNIFFASANDIKIKDNRLLAGGLKSTKILNVEFDARITNWNPLTGGQSYGYDLNSGIKIQVKPTEMLFTSEVNNWDDSDDQRVPYFNINNDITSRMTFRRGETYYLGIVWVSNKGEELFVSPIGKLKMPSLEDVRNDAMTSEADRFLGIEYMENQSPVIDYNGIENTRTSNNNLYVRYVNLVVSARIPKEIRDIVSGFRIVHIERTRYNSTIIDQGIGMPMITQFNFLYHSFYHVKEDRAYFEKPNEAYICPGFIMPLLHKDEYFEDFQRMYRTKNLVGYYSPLTKFKGGDSFNRLTGLYLDFNQNVTAFNKTNQEFFNAKNFKTKLRGGALDLESRVMLNLFRETQITKENFSTVYKVDVPVLDYSYLAPGVELPLSSLKLDSVTTASGKAIPSSKIINKNPSLWWHYSPFRVDDYGDITYHADHNNNNASDSEGLFVFSAEDTINLYDIDQSIAVPQGATLGISSNLDEVVSQFPIITVKQNLIEQYGVDPFESSNQRYVATSDFIKVNKYTQDYEVVVEGDSYMTAFNLMKNTRKGEMDKTQREDYLLNAKGWGFIVVLESDFAYEYASGERFNKDGVNLFKGDALYYNEAYESKNTIKSYRLKPWNFEEISNLKNVLAASKIKVNGEYYDAFSEFPAFDFFELEINKGTINNIVASTGNMLHIIQDNGVAIVGFNSRALVQSQDGKTINIHSGTGTIFEYYEYILEVGSSIKNNSIVAQDGFFFFSEKNKELYFIKGRSFDAILARTRNRKLIKDLDVSDVSFHENVEKTLLYINIKYSDNTSEILVYSYFEKNILYTLTKGFDFGFNALGKIYHIKDNDIYEFGVGDRAQLFEERVDSKITFVVIPTGQDTVVFNNFIGYLRFLENSSLKISKIEFKDNNGNTATITENDRKYRIREGKHLMAIREEKTLAQALSSLSYERADRIRGEWMEVDITFEFTKSALSKTTTYPKITIDDPESFWCLSINTTGMKTGIEDNDLSSNYNKAYLQVPVTSMALIPTSESLISVNGQYMFDAQVDILTDVVDVVRIYHDKFEDITIVDTDTVALKFNACDYITFCNEETYDEAHLEGGLVKKPVITLNYKDSVWIEEQDYQSLYGEFNISRQTLATKYELEYSTNGGEWQSMGITSYNCADDVNVLVTGVMSPYDPFAGINLRVRARSISINTEISPSDWQMITVEF